ncbi:MAG TPA: hypothetical protein VE685_11755, partial [Thermoanaerobaculia bacterium]|nr:hypothetical protein [Thermoanaerobaculia bacterium]
MSGNKRLPAAVFAGGLVALVALVGCEREPSVASKGAAAFRESQEKGETFEATEHSHGHGAITPGGGQEAGAGAADHAHHEAATPGHAHAPAGASHDHSAMGHGSEAHAAGHASRRSAAPQSGGHGGHAGMDHGPSHAAPSGRTSEGPAETGGATGHDEHAGHSALSPQAPPAGGQSSSGGHAGHSPARGSTATETAVAAPEAVTPGQPAATLRPDALDAPAATSVLDAQRSAAMAEEMRGGGGHGGHGTGTYRQVDAGRGPGAYQGSEEQTPGSEPHLHGPALAPAGPDGGH